ncbi:MAG: histidine ammonia-lyase [Anaerolineales bacterium]|nr:histidine ammonia-lyase [Anaerolineales bacterium]
MTNQIPVLHRLSSRTGKHLPLVTLDGQSLTLDQVIAVAYGQPGSPRVDLSQEAVHKVERAAKAVERMLAEGQVAYGITTGFGAFKDRIISREQVGELQHNIILSHAVGVGTPFDIPTVRAIMLIRANTLTRGHSGIKLETVELLVDLLNKGIHPLIPQKGSLGASGDLAPLSHMSLVLLGLGDAEYQGQVRPGAETLEQANLKPVTLAAKEGLALVNGTAVMCALGALEAYHAQLLSRTADITGCLSLEALHGTPLAFDDRIHRLRPFPRQLNCAAYLRELLTGSEFTRHHDPANVQDAYSLRCIPQVHGAIRDALAYARWVIEIELNAVTDNPLIFFDEENGEATVLSGGNFHGEPLAIAMDYMGLALTELGNISERRLMRLTDEASNAHVLPAFLTRHGGLNSGFMITQYTAAALAAENKVLSHPASADTIPTSANVEDHVSMGCTAALKARQIVNNVEYMLALEFLAAAQGIDFRKQKLDQNARLGKGTQPAYDLIREQVPFVEQDTLLQPYIEAARKLIASGKLVKAVNKEVEDMWEPDS